MDGWRDGGDEWVEGGRDGWMDGNMKPESNHFPTWFSGVLTDLATLTT